MRKLALTLLLCACTANPNDNGGADGGGGGADGGGGGGGDAGLGQDAAIGPDDLVFEMTPFPVGAGEEVFRCQNFANPVGTDIEVQEWESHMTAGSHHLLVFYQANAQNTAVESCSGLEFKSGPYGSQTPDAKIRYPDGVAAVVSKSNGLRFASHYLNASPNPIMAQVKVIARRATPGSVQNRAGVFFFNNVAIYVPKAPNPQSPPNYPISKTCTIPRDVNFLFATGHMHKFAKNLTAKLNGNVIYSTDSWDNSPFVQFMPVLQLKQGQQIEFTCTYQNTTNGILTFGDSAETNEMCIFDGQFYPDPTGNGFGC